MGQSNCGAGRRVVTGVRDDGRSGISSDDVVTRIELPKITRCEIWRVDELPPNPTDGDGLDERLLSMPAAAGFVYRIATFPPDEEWLGTDEERLSTRSTSGAAPPDSANGIVGLHVTPTVDISTVIEGELWAVLETEQTLLRAGDTIVQRGTQHSWCNRSGKPATVVSVMLGSEPYPIPEPTQHKE